MQKEYMNVAPGVYIDSINTMTSTKSNVVEHGQSSSGHGFTGKQNKSNDK